jgi:pimeloyl-ACP methyl ester carboxylesterase
MPVRHCIRAAVLLLLLSGGALPAAAQQPASDAPGTGEASFTVFARATMVGTERIEVTRDAGGWTITSAGRLAPPLDIVTRRLEIRYDPDWKPIELTLDATVRGQIQTIHTTLEGDTATSQVRVGGENRVITATTGADVFLPNPFFAPFEAVTARLRTAARGSTIAAFAPAQSSMTISVGESTTERIQTPSRTIEVKRTRLIITGEASSSPPVEVEVWADEDGRLLRLSVPAQSLEVLRDDVASVATRQVPISRPNDEQVRIPGNGFVMVGTLSKPVEAGPMRLPAVVLVGGSGPTDRDEVAFGIPIFGQLADALAEAGFVVLRYDKRGVGQSGGREEAATLADYAEDVRRAVRFLERRKDVDPKRIVVAGYGEGGPIAMLAASKEKRIAALALLAATGVTGAELNLDQVKRALDRSNRSAADKQATLDLQQRIQQAVLTGSGWETLALYRKQADTPWFQSFLAFDPARIMRDVKQPVLIVQGELDTQVTPANADRLQALAAKRKNAPRVQLARIPGVNHLLVPAATGETDEYTSLKDKNVSVDVSRAIVSWLQTIPPR